MADSNFGGSGVISYLLGAVQLLWLLLLGRTHASAKSAHDSIAEERKLNDAKATVIHEKINKSINQVSLCRQQVDENIRTLSKDLMTELQVKDFVDRSIKPLENQISAIDRKITDSHKEIMGELRK